MQKDEVVKLRQNCRTVELLSFKKFLLNQA